MKIDAAIWKKKAMAFVIRSHRHLWGKNNEDPLAYLFSMGLRNDFCKQHYLGWNKFGQKRPYQNWGFGSRPEQLVNQGVDQSNKFLLPSGIVFPFIIEKDLISVFIHSLDENATSDENARGRIIMMPGSSSATIFLGEIKETVVILEDLFDGLFLYQEAGKTCSVIIHSDPSEPLNLSYQLIIKQATTVYVLSKKNKNRANKRQIIIPDLPEKTFGVYISRQDLADRFLS